MVILFPLFNTGTPSAFNNNKGIQTFNFDTKTEDLSLQSKMEDKCRGSIVSGSRPKHDVYSCREFAQCRNIEHYLFTGNLSQYCISKNLDRHKIPIYPKILQLVKR